MCGLAGCLKHHVRFWEFVQINFHYFLMLCAQCVNHLVHLLQFSQIFCKLEWAKVKPVVTYLIQLFIIVLDSQQPT